MYICLLDVLRTRAHSAFFSLATEAHHKKAGKIKIRICREQKNQRRDALNGEVFQLKTTSNLFGN
jgi:hypothetical protein